MKTGTFIFSTEDMRHYYRIADNRPSAAGGPFYWTMGSHNGYRADNGVYAVKYKATTMMVYLHD